MSNSPDAIDHSSVVPLAVYGKNRRRQILPGVLVVIAALLTALFSFLVLIGLTPIEPNEQATLWLVTVNGFVIALLAGLIGREIFRIVKSRRTVKAASRLHVRIILLFATVAAVPAIAVAIFASVTLGVGLDRWFETRTKEIVNSSIGLAEAYIEENARNLQGTTISMAFDLDKAKAVYSLDRNGFQQIMTRQAVGRALAGAWLLHEDGSVEMDANVPDSGNLPHVPMAALKTAADGKPVLIPPRTRNLVGAVFKLRDIEGLYLYTIRTVDPKILETLSIMQANTKEYRGLEANRYNTQIAFALLYIGLTLIVLLSAIWTAIAVADRLVRPIRQLIGAADEVAAGNLGVVVPVRSSDGDVGSLANTFNKMTAQLKSQREELISAKDQIDERRRFSEAVLSGVSAGVIGVDPAGRISIVNRSGEHMFGLDPDKAVGKPLAELLPAVKDVFDAARRSGRLVYRDQAVISADGSERTFNIQITVEESESSSHSCIVTIDDITDLVAAQRSSAWADVARRIAHEIKNPLTPIQLSAERIKRRYGRMVENDRAVFDQCTDTIIRQVGDIGRMVDEFSAFARMPKPTMVSLDLTATLREATFLAELRRDDIEFKREFGNEPLIGTFDSRLIGQAIGNIIKNAAEAIEPEIRGSGRRGKIEIRAYQRGSDILVDVIDNGKGLPRENRQRLLEPYMTTRDKGTGLGLAIVKKVVEDHHGRLELHDAPKEFDEGRGAMIRMIFPAGTDSQAEMSTSIEQDTAVSEQA